MFFRNNNNKIIENLDEIIDYLNNKTNYANKSNIEFNGHNRVIKEKLDLICDILNKRNDDELLIYGEVMLVVEKMMKGDFSDRINHTNTSNIKLNYIANALNILLNFRR